MDCINWQHGDGTLHIPKFLLPIVGGLGNVVAFSSFPLKEVIWLPGADGLIPSQIPISGKRYIRLLILMYQA